MPQMRIVQIPLAVSGPRGVNVFVVVDSKAIVVDSGVPGSAPQILEAMERERIAPADVSLILITHAHIDHIGSAAEMKRVTEAPIAIQTRDAAFLREGGSAPVVPRTPDIARAYEEMTARMGTPPPVAAVEPDIIIEEELPLAQFGIAGRARHAQGHTDGGLVIELDSGEVIVGDLIGGKMGEPLEASLAPFAVDGEALTRSVRDILALDPTRAYAGHGGPFGREQLAKLAEGLDRD